MEKMKTAIVTGATSGIGLEIAKRLVKLQYKVYGVGRDFEKINFKDENFINVECDITKTNELVTCMKNIKNSENVYIVVNSAGIGYFGLHEELNPLKIHKLISTNLEAPIIICNQLLRDLKKNKGWIINISSIEAKKSSIFGCAYGATKAGLTHFSESLFDETRKYGVKVVTIHPDITKTPFYDNLNFKEGENFESYITPECIANAVEMALSQREGTIVTEFTIRPQKFMIKKKN